MSQFNCILDSSLKMLKYLIQHENQAKILNFKFNANLTRKY